MKTGYKSETKKADMTKAYAMPMEEKSRISIDDDLLPEVKRWNIDTTYEVVLKVKLVGIHKKYDSDKVCADFEILSAENDADEKENGKD